MKTEKEESNVHIEHEKLKAAEKELVTASLDMGLKLKEANLKNI